MKRTLIALSCVVVGTIGFGQTYFENEFFCDISSSSITVSLKEGDTLCFDIIEKVATKITSLQEDIDASANYIQAQRDVEYWTQVQSRLVVEKETFVRSREQIIVAMNDYERELFVRIKSLTFIHLRPEREAIEDKIKQSDSLLLYMKLSGNIEQYGLVLEKRDELYRQWILLEAVREAQRFEELIFPLRTYLQQTVAQ